MDKEKAILIISDLNEALFKAKVALKADDEKDKRIVSLKKHIQEHREAFGELKKKYTKDHVLVNTILPLYEKECSRRFDLCPDCKGAGGFDTVGDMGELCYEPCTTCKETGLIISEKKM